MDLYKNEKFCERARWQAVDADFLTNYANSLNSDRQVIADLKFAHEADSSHYSDDEYANLGAKVLALISKTISTYGLRSNGAEASYEREALADFNAWYLEMVIYGKVNFDAALSEYLKQSPFVLRP